MKKTVVIVLLIIATVVLFNKIFPKRTPATYCKTFQTESEKLHKQWREQSKNGSDVMGNLAMLAGAPKDMENFFDKLYQESPDEIRGDVKTLRDAAKKAGEINPGNLIGSLASSLMLGLSTKGAEDRVNTYTEKNCSFPGMVKNKPTPTVTKKPEPDKIFDSNSKGILAIYDDHNEITSTVYAYSLVLINPENFKIVAEFEVPRSGWFDEKGKKFSTVAKLSSSYERYHLEEFSWDSPRNYSKDFRYVPIQYERESEGSQDVGYLDITTKKATNISGDTDKSSFGSLTVKDEDPFFNPFDPNMLLFLRDGKRHVYYMDSKKIEPYDKDITDMQKATFKSIREQEFGKSVNKATRYMLAFNDKAQAAESEVSFTGSYDCRENHYLNAKNSTVCSEGSYAAYFNCSESSIWLNENTYFCHNNNQFFKIDISKVKPVTANDGEFYLISPPAGLLPKNDRGNSLPIISPDGKNILFNSSKGKEKTIYSMSIDGGEPKEIKKLTGNSFPYHYLFWR